MGSHEKIDFQGLAEELLSRASSLLPHWLPGGSQRGTEYVCGNLSGGKGTSCSINTRTGRWGDFATDQKGGDLISLYAAIHQCSQYDAAVELMRSEGIGQASKIIRSVPARIEPETQAVSKPPLGTAAPDMVHRQHGAPTTAWCYKDRSGAPIFWVARYETPDGKLILPWSWAGDRWVMRGQPVPRPLYGLEVLEQRPSAPVLIVEGEKAAEAARTLCGHIYAVVTWPNGSKAVSKVDWTPVFGRSILIWPDADAPGRECAIEIAETLRAHCPEVKVLGPDDKPDGWDAADAVAEGWDWPKMREWAKAHVSVYNVLVVQQNTTNNYTSEDEDAGEVPASLHAIWDKLGVPVAGNGQPICNLDAATRVLQNHPSFNTSIWFDEFHGRYFTTWLTEGRPVEWSDVYDIWLAQYMQRDLGMRKITDEMVRKAIVGHANRSRRNEPLEWMEHLSWDGQARIERFFSDCLGAADSQYAQAASKNWWVSMVARVYRPGCKVDNMVILEGAQGRYKSTALGIIGGRWYTEAHESVTSKDFYMLLQGKLIVEISELDSFNKAEVTKIKQVISCQTDRFRPPYGRVSADFPRRCVFVGSTNEDAYLRDPTGARRFWPIKTGRIDIERIRTDREQLFAEAVVAFKAGATWYEMPDTAIEVQESRRQVDEWEAPISAFVSGRFQTTSVEIATDALNLDVSRLDMLAQKRIAGIMAGLSWTRDIVRDGERTLRVWNRPQARVAVPDDEPF